MPIDANSALELQAAVLSRRRFEEAAATFVTRLAQLFEFERASIGFIEAGYARVIAISHGAALDAAQDLNREVSSAMDEAIDQAATVAYPAPPGARPTTDSTNPGIRAAWRMDRRVPTSRGRSARAPREMSLVTERTR